MEPKTYKFIRGNCLDMLSGIPAGSAQAVITDPPYPEIDRPYGRLSEAEWHALMHEVVIQCRRILSPNGSMAIILQPNSKTPGSMRLWLWEFLLWCGKTWNLVQDVYWWNYTSLPVGGAITHGLMRESVKPIIWLGNPDCYRNQRAALWRESFRNIADRVSRRAGNEKRPSGRRIDRWAMSAAAVRNGGVTPYNLLPFHNANSTDSAGARGHGAGTPEELADWLTKYICPPGGTVLDPFAGAATIGVAGLKLERSYIGIERFPDYWPIAEAELRRWGKAAE